MKRKVYIITLLLTICFLVACSKEKQYIEDFNNSTTQSNEETVLQWCDIDTSLTQSNSINQVTAYSNSGIYYIKYNKIYYCDYATQKVSVWCNKLECQHDSYDCTAYVYPEKNSTGLLFYQSGKIYLVARDEDGYFLESYNEDGSNYQVICRLWTTNSAIFYQENGDEIIEMTARMMSLDKGKAYYAVSNMKEIKVYEVDLKPGSTPKEIACIKDEQFDKLSIGLLKVTDTYIVLDICKSKISSSLEEGESYESEDYIYSISKNDYTLKEIGDYNISNFMLYNDEIYGYKNTEGFFKIDIVSGKEKVLNTETTYKWGRIFRNEQYIIMFAYDIGVNSKGHIWVYDYNYKLLEEIVTTGMEDVTGFDGRFVYGYKLYDYRNTPDNKADDSPRDAIWPIEDVGKEDKRYYFYGD